MQVPVVECLCGNRLALSQERNTIKLLIICPVCFRKLMWKDERPVSINSAGEINQVKFLGVTEI